MKRNVLVTGATGKQGQALIRALLHAQEAAVADDHIYHIYALTRKASSPGAQALAERWKENLTVVEGDLDDRASISKIFGDTKGNGGIWGVFAVLAYPGLGAEADGEEEQGKVWL